jgi:hypothetical protein
MVLAISLIVFSPLLILFAPLVIGETVYFDRLNWVVYLPKINFVLVGISMLLLLAGFVVLWIKNINRMTIATALLLTVASGIVFYGASLSYTTLTDETITHRKPFEKEKQQYSWEDLESVQYYDNEDNLELSPYYSIYFQDGKELKLVQGGILDIHTKIRIDQKLRSLKTPVEVIQQK